MNSTSFGEFIEARPNLRYLFFGGKGGVGKSVVSAGAAYYFAEHRGEKTLVYSMNPIHSLATIFGQEFSGEEIRRVKGAEHLYAIETEISYATGKYRQSIRNRILDYLKQTGLPFIPELFSDVDRSLDQFIDVLTTNPAFEESLMFNGLIDLILEGEFDRYVIDTAPVAFTHRLLKVSKAYDYWLEKFVKQREELHSRASAILQKKVSQTEQVVEKMKKDPLILGLLATRERTEEGRKLLQGEKTAFFFVTLPLKLPIMVMEKSFSWIRSLDIPVGGVIVNKVISRERLDLSNALPYVLNQIEEQDQHVKMVHDKFPGLVMAHIPLFDTEIHGVNMIAEVAEALI